MRRFARWCSFAAMAITLVVAGCGGGNAAVVRVDGAVDRPANYGTAELGPLGNTTQTVAFGSGSGPQTHTYTGTALWSVLNNAGIKTDASKKNDLLNRYVLATGADGYKTVFALGELSPDYGNKPSVLAYVEALNGASAVMGPPDGPFRVTAPGDVKGGRYVSNLVRLDVRTSGSTAAGTGGGISTGFAVSGAVTTGKSFDLAALQSLPATTQTVGGVAYTGVSLWTLLNTATGLRTDTSVKNASLAMYAVATGSDGYRALLSLGEIDPGFGNKTALIAYASNGAGLGANGVARLVVPGEVKQSRSVSNLVSIEVFAAPSAQ